ncbi:hypothetical protein ACFOWM_07060 [Ferruginibacter yonginensis]|uniref:Right handed beta helix region n=1 Tax=Ferruginibacter yonginensis TaxID=1310416 RepID=A0ABV8QRA1_9BACT
MKALLKKFSTSPIAWLIILVVATSITSCKKESFITDAAAQLGISKDTIRFDTVFTSVGSITQSFKIFNNNNQKLKLSSIQLMGGNSSAYKLNVNGVASNMVNNIDIAANDSIYVFVTVNINPTPTNVPFIVADSIAINYNGNKRFVQLEAFGKNAIFIRNGIINSNTTFNNNLPYVILGGLQINNGATLSINAGTKIYCHANAPIIVNGTLLCNGNFFNPIIFSGDRLDAPYNTFPAAWPGIIFNSTSSNNQFTFTNINQAYQAIVTNGPSPNSNPKLTLQQCIIDNAFDAGIHSNNSSINANNCLISNCGSNIKIELGGTYNFTHCTVASYSNNVLQHKKPTIFLSNSNVTAQTNNLNATLRNCIFYGDAGFVNNEIETEKIGNAPYSITIDHCLYRGVDPSNATIITSIKNIDPLFDSINNNTRFYDFNITKDANAPGINKGTNTSLLKDLNDKNRNVGLPDIGAYEKQ